MGLMRHPALLLAIVWVALLVLASLRRRAELGDSSGPRGLMFAASIAVIVSYCAIVVWYTFKASYFDAAEPTITAVAAAFASGHPCIRHSTRRSGMHTSTDRSSSSCTPLRLP